MQINNGNKMMSQHLSKINKNNSQKEELGDKFKDLTYSEAYYLLNEVDDEGGDKDLPKTFKVKQDNLSLIFNKAKNDRIKLNIEGDDD